MNVEILLLFVQVVLVQNFVMRRSQIAAEQIEEDGDAVFQSKVSWKKYIDSENPATTPADTTLISW